MKRIFFPVWVLILLCISAQSQISYTVNSKDRKFPIQSTMWGLFFEDINRAADGGIYAELIKNRSFDFPDAFMGWVTQPARHVYAKNEIFQIINQSKQFLNDPKYLQVTRAKSEPVAMSNEGFGGVTVNKNAIYIVSIVYRQQQKGLTAKFDITNAKNNSVGSSSVDFAISKDWKTITTNITTTDTTVNGRFLITFDGIGTIDIDRISLMPADATKNLRTDLVTKLADIKPGFLRFPGGCIVEGDNTDTRYQWKNTIGTLEQRKLNSNQWSDGGASNRPMKDYFQSYGLGFYEYFQLCEDLKADPMPIINAGLSCQFGAGEVIPANEMDQYVQDALDLIEFANADANTTWGKRRAALGHPAPFNMKLLGVGNENWGPQYVERLELFTKAIKAKYPYIQIICATGYTPNPQFKYMDSVLRARHVDIIDEHYYQTVPWFLMNAGKYDNYDRKGPKIFIGEYACHSLRIGNPENKNTQLCALAEAAWMTGLERNADIVTMAAYAPLFAHVKDWQWTPNLIWFDNAKSYATPSYYVQQLFSLNKGTDVISITQDGNAIKGQDSIWASAVTDSKTGEIIIKLVNPSSQQKQRTISLDDIKKSTTTGVVTTLQGQPGDINGLDKETIVPVTNTIAVKNKKLNLVLVPYSLTVIRVRI